MLSDYAALLRSTLWSRRPGSVENVNNSITRNNKSLQMLINEVIHDCYQYEHIKLH